MGDRKGGRWRARARRRRCTGGGRAAGRDAGLEHDGGQRGLEPRALPARPGAARASWVGLSEIVTLADGSFGFIERDNLTGDFSQIKNLVRVDLSQPVTGSAKQRFDLLAPLRASHGWINDKPEGFTVAKDGKAYVVTDNDGVDDASGETQLLRLGNWRHLFAR